MAGKRGRAHRQDRSIVKSGSLKRAAIESLEGRSLLSTYFVDASAPGPTYDGSSWNSAYVDLQQAIAVAVAEDEIRVADGLYKPTSGTDRTISFRLLGGVKLLGGYAGAGAANPDARDTGLYVSVLSGEIGAAGDYSDNSYHVVHEGTSNSSSLLEGFTITRGNGNGATNTTDRGGGIFIEGRPVTIRRCIFIENIATRGGALSNSSQTSPKIDNCEFVRNQASTNGGAIYNTNNLVLNNCIVAGNVAGSDGGGIYGGVTIQLNNTVFVGNKTAGAGGAVAKVTAGYARFQNCTIAGNVQQGIYLGSASVGSNASWIRNSIVWENSFPGGVQIAVPSNVLITNSDIQGGSPNPGTGNRDIDPHFVRDPSPGADKEWGTADDDYGDLRITAISPVVDAGDNLFAPIGMTADVAGNARFQDILTTPDTGLGAAPIIDLGAYEAIPQTMAEASGPYSVVTGLSIPLLGQGASTAAGSLQFAWEWDGDGQFDEATGANLLFDSTGYSPGTVLNVLMRMTDGNGQIIDDSTTITIVPSVVYVDIDATGGNDGTSWQNAYTNLGEALAQSAWGQTIKVAGGTYKPTAGLDRTLTFDLKSGISVLGGYAGTGNPEPDNRNPAIYQSVLSGDIGVEGTNTDNSYHVLTAVEVDSAALIDGFTITGGNARGAANSGIGGGMYIAVNSALVIRNCRFVGNIAQRGGAIGINPWSMPTIANCSISGNAASMGGGISIGSSSANLINCTLSGNEASIRGGGIWLGGSTLTASNCVFWGNVAPLNAQIDVQQPVLTVISNSDIQGGYTGSDNINADPLFAREPDPGPDGAWGTSDDDYGDLRLQTGSPCIDVGDSSIVPDSLTRDLTWDFRLADVVGVHDLGLIVDMGAYEAIGNWGALGSFEFNSPQQAVKLRFSRELFLDGLAIDDLIITRVGIGDPINYAIAASIEYDETTSIARWNFSSSLPDGNYRATLLAGSVADASNVLLPATSTFDFFVLAADANRDRKVDVNDLYILSQHWLGTGKTFSQGDFNYDGMVDQKDLGIMAQRWQAYLAEPPPAAPPVTTSAARRAPVRTPTRVTETILQ